MFFNLLVQFSLQSVRIKAWCGVGGVGLITRPLSALYLYGQPVSELGLLPAEPQSSVNSS